MHPLIGYEVVTARIADLRRQAHHDALARAAAHVPSGAPLPGRHPIAVSRRRVGRPRRFGMQLWTLLHAQALLDRPATVPHRRHRPGHTGTFPVPPGMRATTTSMSGSPARLHQCLAVRPDPQASTCGGLARLTGGHG
jgi:hypothetical protein